MAIVRAVTVRRLPSWITPAGVLLLVAAATRIWAAVWDQGMIWPDEIFQTLEQAHRFAFGQGVVPWEFRDVARSWFYPGIIGLVWKGAGAVGVTSALTLVQLAKLGMAALSIWGVAQGMKLARLLGGAQAELLAALFGALCPIVVIFSSRCMTECASAPFIAAGAVLVELPPLRRRAFLAGVCIGLSVLFRIQNGILAVGFLLILMARRRWRDSLAYVGGGFVMAVVGGVVDWKASGGPFLPAYNYVTWSLKGGPDGWGTSPYSFFSEHLGITLGISYVVLALGLFVAARASRGLVIVVLVFMAIHLKVPHKEVRFLLPVIPLALALSAVGLAQLLSGLRLGPRPTYVFAVVCGLQMAWQLRAPTLGDLGYDYSDDVVWHANEDYYRASLEAADDPNLCGISYVDNAHAWTSGYTYLHRDVPLFFDLDPRDLAAANYVVGAKDAKLPAAWTKVSVHGKFALFHREGKCGPVPPGWTLDQL
jgi:phosphatidylinositol glycan class B